MGYATEGKKFPLVELAFNTPGRETEADEKGQLALHGDDLGPLAAQIDARIKALLDNFKSNSPVAQKFAEVFPHAVRQVEYDGRTLELNVYDSEAAEIMSLIGYLKTVRQAQENKSRLWFVFRRGMTTRGDHLLRIVARQQSSANIEQLVDACRGVLDEFEVRKAIQRLEDLGHVRCSGDEVRMTETGRAIL